MMFLGEDILQIDIERLPLKLNLQLFAEGGDGGEKTEEATQKKLDDARKEGQVAKSQELTTSVMLFALFVSLRVFSGYIGNNFLKTFKEYYDVIHVYGVEKPTNGVAVAFTNQALIRILLTLMPLAAIAFFIAFLVNYLQVRWKPAPKALQPKMDKINPLKGFKRIFSKDKIFELFKDIAKIVLIFIIAYNTIIDEVEKLKIMYDLGLMAAVTYIGNFVLSMGIKISAFYLGIGLIDYIYHFFKFKKDMRMSKQEVKEEFKQMEGNPEVKNKMKQRMRQSSQAAMRKAVPDADVVITNPTHFACAIKYDKDKAAAPVLTAKGADYMAQKIKEIARENNVPIVENKALARMLYYNVDVDSQIPEELYQTTAEVLAYVYGLKGKTG